MRNIRTTAIVIALSMLPALGWAAPAPAPASAAAREIRTVVVRAPMHATRGIVRFVDANRLVISRSPRASREMVFTVTPATERLGHVRVGSVVDVRYRTHHRQQVATAITVEHGRS
jgi:hypothetical protein